MGGKRSRILEWTPEITFAFDQLKKEMQADIELAYPNYDNMENKLELYVDASDTGEARR